MTETLEQGKNVPIIDKDAGFEARSESSKVPQGHLAATHKADDISQGNAKEILTLVGKELASNLGSRVLLAMLAESRMSMREVARRSGFDVSLLSNIAKGKRASGPELWTLIALADAMELDLDLTFSKR